MKAVQKQALFKKEVSALMKRMDRAFVVRQFWFRDNGLVNITASRAKGLISMMLS